MNIAVDTLSISVLKKPLQECNLAELRQLTEQYPYFGPAQLLLAKKLQDENSSQYEDQVQKTSLYFPNRLWLQHLLSNGADNDPGVTEHTGIIEEAPQIAATPVVKEMMTEEETLAEPVTGTSVELAADPAQEPATVEEQPLVTATAEQIPDPVSGKQAETPALAESDQEILFEPYHTVDYFASQGIILREEEKTADRFSQQLKSFTEWLKVMKRIPASEIPENDVNRERNVQLMADHSIVERHIITEAMAEIWEKQGNKARAEEIYRKLSLLDPSKSSYFAAKIEELKKTS